MKVEYLLAFNTKNNICKTISSLKSLLDTHSELKISWSNIKYKSKKFIIKIELNKLNKECYSIFHVILEDKNNFNEFDWLNTVFRKVIWSYLKEDYQVIWDERSFNYSKELYWLIYEVENQMRLLISKFMLKTLWINWAKDSLPDEVKDTVRNEEKINHWILYKVDFIALSQYLLRKYCDKDWLLDFIAKEKKDWFKNISNNIDLYIPKNNWDRYFKNVLNIESSEFESKWKKMYEYRNTIAHNKIIDKALYTQTMILWKELKKIISKAIIGISTIKVEEKDVKNISELNSKINYISTKWNTISSMLWNDLANNIFNSEIRLIWPNWIWDPAILNEESCCKITTGDNISELFNFTWDDWYSVSKNKIDWIVTSICSICWDTIFWESNSVCEKCKWLNPSSKTVLK